MKKERLRKRFTVTLISLAAVIILPIVYVKYGIEATIQTAVITSIATLASLFLVSQGASDTATNWNTNE